MTGVSLVFGYGLLGATWCVMKTTGELEIWARRMALRFLIGTVVAMALVVSLWVPFLGRQTRGALVLLAQHRLPGADPAGHGLRGLPALPRPRRRAAPARPFFLAIALFLLGYLGLGVSLFPYIVPPNLTIWQAANTVNSQLFALVGFAIVLPFTFGYTAYAYWVFRGKVAEDVQAAAITDDPAERTPDARSRAPVAPRLVRRAVRRQPRGLRGNRLRPARPRAPLISASAPAGR